MTQDGSVPLSHRLKAPWDPLTFFPRAACCRLEPWSVVLLQEQLAGSSRSTSAAGMEAGVPCEPCRRSLEGAAGERRLAGCWRRDPAQCGARVQTTCPCALQLCKSGDARVLQAAFHLLPLIKPTEALAYTSCQLPFRMEAIPSIPYPGTQSHCHNACKVEVAAW